MLGRCLARPAYIPPLLRGGTVSFRVCELRALTMHSVKEVQPVKRLRPSKHNGFRQELRKEAEAVLAPLSGGKSS